MNNSPKSITRIAFFISSLTLTLTLTGMPGHTARITANKEAARNSTSADSMSKQLVTADIRAGSGKSGAGDRGMNNTAGGRTYYWVALPSRKRWSDRQNWRPHGVPGPGDRAVLDGHSQQFAQEIHLDRDIEVSSLILLGNTLWDPRAELRSSDNTKFTITITDEFTASEVAIHLGAKIVTGENCVVTIFDGEYYPTHADKKPQGVNLGKLTEDPGFLTINGRGSLTGQLKIGTGSALTVGAGGGLTFRSGLLAGSGLVTINGGMLWESGTLGDDAEREAGTTVIAPGATLNLNLSGTSLGSDRVLGKRTVINRGEIIVGPYPDRGTLCGHDFTLDNEGVIEFGYTIWGSPPRPGMSFTKCAPGDNPGTILNKNTGTFRKSWGTDVREISHNFINRGTVEVGGGGLSFPNGYIQDAGETRANGSLKLGNNQLDLRGGELTGGGVIEGSVVNGGIIKPGGSNRAGVLTVTGNYTQAPKGKIEIEIGGNRDSDFDRLITNSVSTTATSKLAGVVEVRLLDVVETVMLGLSPRRVNHGPFQPLPNDIFPIMQYQSRNGEFSKVSGLVINKGLAFTHEYQTNELRLVTIQRP